MTVPVDPYNFVNGATADADQVDARFLPLYTALNGALDVDNFLTTVKQKLGLSDASTVRRGKSIIAAAGTRTNAAYGALSNGPDQVASVVLPTDGLIAVAFQATWKESVEATARAAIFLGANQLKRAPANGAPGVQEATVNTPAGFAGNDHALSTVPTGLLSSTGALYSGDVTTGQVVGHEASERGGPCLVFAAAGTYTVSVQFKASSGTVTASNRKLWVWTMAF